MAKMRKDAIIAAAGIAGGQGIVVLATPVLARIYSPAEFGEYGALVAVAGVIATVSALRFDVAIPAVSDDEVMPLFQVALIAPIVVCSIFGVIAAFVPSEILVRVGMPAALLWGVLVVALLQCSLAVCQAMLLRQGEFFRGAILRVVQPLVFVAIAVMYTSSLFFALVSGWVIAIVTALIVARIKSPVITWRQTLEVFRGAWRYPLISAPMALLDTLSLALPLLFIVDAFGNQAAGNYSQMQRLIAAPLLLMGVATSQVFFKHAGDKFRRGEAVEPLLRRVVALLAVSGALLAAAIWLVGEPLMHLLLGDAWRTDTRFILLVSVPVLIRVTVSPVSSVFLITNRVGLGAFWQLGYFMLTIGLLVFARGRLSLDEFLMAYVMCELFAYLCYFGLAIAAARGNPRQAPIFRDQG